jgi:ubiquinone/menaquinone biosynthesis C-methylase UbiE
MSDQQTADVWAAGAAYEPYVGRWSRLVALEFLRWLNVPTDSDWLDVGCGTGALTQTILQNALPRTIASIDQSAGFIAYASQQVVDERITFHVGDAQSLPFDTADYDAVVSGLVLNFIPHPDRALQEMRRVVRPGGLVAVYVWDYADKMELMRHFWNAVTELDPSASNLDEGQRFPICHPEALAEHFRAAGLQNVETRAIDIDTYFRDFDDYWSPFLGGQGPAPTYVMSLNEQRRADLRERIRAGLPVAPDGSIPLVARAWAVRGQH